MEIAKMASAQEKGRTFSTFARQRNAKHQYKLSSFRFGSLKEQKGFSMRSLQLQEELLFENVAGAHKSLAFLCRLEENR